MAVFSGINNTGTFNPGFSFSDLSNAIQSSESALASLVGSLTTNPDNSGQYSDGSYFADWWATDTHLWFKGSVSGDTFTLKELDLSNGSGFDIGFTGSGTINTQTGTVSSISAKEVWLETPDGYSIDYRGSLNFDLNTGGVSGSLKTLYLVAENGSDPGDADYVKISGSVTMDANGTFTGGQVTSIEWGTLTFSESDGEPTFSITGKVTGLKIDAASLESILPTDGFDGLMSLAYSGNDTVTGTAGDDTLDVGAGNDKVFGNEGNDHIVGDNGNDTIDGGAGNDTIYGDTSDAATNAGFAASNDKITDLLGDNTVDGGSGNNTITLGSGNDQVSAGDGNNKIIAGDGYNIVHVGNGNNNITAGNGAAGTPDWMNQIFAGNGNNKIVTGSGDDLVVAGNGNNNVSVGEGNNEVDLGTGNNKVVTGNGNNDVWIGSEAAFNTYMASGGATKGNGNNTITTGTGNDSVATWEGNDSAKVGAGADQVDLGSGNNKIDLGADTAEDVVTFGWDFLAAVTDNNVATKAFNAVSNFNVGDALWFNLEDLGPLTAEQIDVSAHASISAGDHVLVLDTSTGKLYYDADGTGNGEAAVQIGLIKGTGLTGASFEVGTMDVTIHSGGAV